MTTSTTTKMTVASRAVTMAMMMTDVVVSGELVSGGSGVVVSGGNNAFVLKMVSGEQVEL